MVQAWTRNKRKSHLSLIPQIFAVLVTITILYSLHRTLRFHEALWYARKDVLDRFTTCNSYVKYGGRTIGWGEGSYTPSVKEDEECDVFSGRWVFDNVSYPLYDGTQCPYMFEEFACQTYNRSDTDYLHWRWQPNDCSLKRWDATEIWEKLRGKRLMYVGDSLNRNQWLSMVCLLQSVIPDDKKSITPYHEHLITFTAEEYNATVEFLWAPLLVDSNSDDPQNHRLNDRIIRPDSASRHASVWEKADILVFNSYLWWRHKPVKLMWKNVTNGVCEDTDNLQAMELVLKTWAQWVDNNVDPQKQRVFFVTMSPTHLWGREWNPGSEGNCYGESSPIIDPTYWGSGSDLPTMSLLHDVLGRLGSKVTVLNITQLSEYRKDGHPSIYRKFWDDFTPEKLSKPESYSDCIHWCLPGVPDVWNQLLFNFL